MPKTDSNLIYCSPQFGPYFGCGDLAICSETSKDKQSYSHFPTTFNLQCGGNCSNKETGRKKMLGIEEGQYFGVK